MSHIIQMYQWMPFHVCVLAFTCMFMVCIFIYTHVHTQGRKHTCTYTGGITWIPGWCPAEVKHEFELLIFLNLQIVYTWWVRPFITHYYIIYKTVNHISSVCVCVCVHARACKRTCTCVYVCSHVYAYSYTHMYMYAHTNTHAHTQGPSHEWQADLYLITQLTWICTPDHPDSGKGRHMVSVTSPWPSHTESLRL